MRFCVIGPAPPFRGGIAQHTELLCRHLSQKHDVHCITFSRLYPSALFPGKSQFSPAAGVGGFSSEALIDTLNPHSWARAAQRVSDLSPDCVIVQWWHPFFALCISKILKAASPRRTIFICHNVLPHEPFPFSRRLAVRTLSYGDGYLVHSVTQEELAQSIAPGRPVRRAALPMSDAFPRRGIAKDDARICLGIKEHTLLFFGMVRRYKGLMTLIRALAQLDGMKVNCVVAGEFYDGITAYRKAISRLQLQDRVKLINRYIPDDDVELYFAAADAVVLPYTSASQSGIVQVAYGFERPVIASAVGGLPEVVKHGETGLLVPPGDSRELAGAIRKFYAEGMADSFTETVRREAGRISWKTVLQEIAALACNPEGAYL